MQGRFSASGAGALHMLGKWSTAELHPQAPYVQFYRPCRLSFPLSQLSLEKKGDAGILAGELDSLLHSQKAGGQQEKV